MKSVYDVEAGQLVHATCLSKYTAGNQFMTIVAIFPAVNKGVCVCSVCGEWIEHKEAVYIQSITMDFSKIIPQGEFHG